ncbi:MAG: hypothetical protein LN568_06155 [Rickettsia endosymbiont of Pseudomimeciton antennatum]|nr:hypothetical protein [Rickettsia endosymbiont of Pseudomimeciton antennatum]
MSNYPRTKVVIIEDIVIQYQDLYKQHSGDAHSISKALSLLMAQSIIKALDEAFATLSLVLPDNLDEKMLDKHFHILNDLDVY